MQDDIQELDRVRVKISLRSEGLDKGAEGKVVMIYGDPPKDADVEFLDPLNKGVKLILIPLRYLEKT
ncbi:hypothetical protein FJZ18_04565 [Candidatus Pacearchaeota archaeon]|nr:hypothetical protein [Candidatus Pacearchaeota archaeon]